VEHELNYIDGMSKTARPSSHRPATLKDVARELGLSVATVSRALAKPEMLRPATAARVREVVDRLGYRPNFAAQNLKKGTTGIIYVVVPSLSPFFLEVFRGAERAALERGYSVVMGHTDRRPDREGEFFDKVSCGQGDGILLVSTVEAVTAVNHKRKLPPIVAVLNTVENQDFPTVRIDHVKGAIEAVNHLMALGHRRIAHITGPARSPVAIHRREGYLAALSAAGINSGEENCVPGEFTIASGETAMASLLARPKRPTAVFCANDEIAIGAIRTIKAAGLRVPQDVSVVGFDDQHISSIYDPPLTTVHLPIVDLGYNAMVKLARILAGEGYEKDMVLNTFLVQRSTTCRAPKKT
jgi:LacI family transcriptional regulator, repressor for deo operon, udp, cdd, tsx, nupC, and nupG